MQHRQCSLSDSAAAVFLVALCTAAGSLAMQVSKRAEPASSGASKSFTVQLPGSEPKGKDSYICSGFEVNDLVGEDNPIFMTKFEPVHAVAERAHHMILYTCDGVPGSKLWDCGHHRVCGSGSPGIVYAWAKNADPTVLPPDVSFEIDRRRHKYFVLQVHYVDELEDKDYTGLKMTYTTEP